MKKDIIIGIVSVIVIVGALSYSGLNIYALDNLQLRMNRDGKFSFFYLGNRGSQLEVCNSLPFPASFYRYDIEIIYKSNKLGTFSTGGATIAPTSSSVIEGKLNTEKYQATLIYFLNFDTEFSGTNVPTIDVKNIRVNTKLDTSIIGVIPYSITREYSGIEFVNFMNQGSGSISCS